jgi:hypothetical protein
VQGLEAVLVQQVVETLTGQLLGPKGPSLLTQSERAQLMLPTAPYDRAVTGHIYRSPLRRGPGRAC